MLVLTRKLRQEIRIGENITVTILRVKGNAVRLGIEAPRNISIKRGELAERDAKHSEEDSLEDDHVPLDEGGQGPVALQATPPLASRLTGPTNLAALAPPTIFG